MCPYSRTAECQLERKWLQIAIDTTHNPQLAMPFICFSSSSPCTRHGPHTLSRTIPIQRAIKDHAASRVLLTACYLAPTLLLPFSNRPCFCLHPPSSYSDYTCHGVAGRNQKPPTIKKDAIFGRGETGAILPDAYAAQNLNCRYLAHTSAPGPGLCPPIASPREIHL